MKKTLFALLTVLILTATLFTVACKKKSSPVNPVVITVSDGEYPITAETTLYDYMILLENGGKLSFTATWSGAELGWFITSVNGVSNGTGSNPCWMIYTDDVNN